MARVDPLGTTDEAFWRALMRIVMALPRRLDTDLMRAVGITTNEYLTLLSLSEAPRRELRMTDLADATGLSGSRMTRLVEGLQARGLAAKRSSTEDGRGYVAGLTPAGLAKVEAAWETHLSSARALVFDHVDPSATTEAAIALSEIAAGLDSRL